MFPGEKEIFRAMYAQVGDAVLRHRADLLTTYTNRYFYACEYVEMQVMSKFVKAIQIERMLSPGPS